MHWIDPDSLPPVKGTVTRFLFNPKGEADGMLLSNGREAHFPPHLSRKVLGKIRSGDVVTLYGVKPRATDMIACVAIDTADGERIDDTGPPHKKKKRSKHHSDHHEAKGRKAEVEAQIERPLHGPRGEVRGVLLVQGDIVRFPPHAAESARGLLTPGEVLAVKGTGVRVGDTQVIEALEWGKSKSKLKPLEPDHAR